MQSRARSGAVPAPFAGLPAVGAGRLRFPLRDLFALPLAAGGRRSAALKRLGLDSVGALLHHLPCGYRPLVGIRAAPAGAQVAVLVSLSGLWQRTGRRVPFCELAVEDRSGHGVALCFNQPWLGRSYRPGTNLLLVGKAVGRGRLLVAQHAAWQGPAPAAAVGRYRSAGSLPSLALGALVGSHLGALRQLPDPLPGRLRCRLGLPSRGEALAALHRPRRRGDLSLARRRLAFDELLALQLRFEARRRAVARQAAPPLREEELARRWLAEGLPFPLTADQRAAVWSLAQALRRRRPLRRLLVGEVGSGKTVVALYALLRAYAAGYQGAFLVPTEALARQHYRTAQALLGGSGARLALLTGAQPEREREELRVGLATGTVDLVVGTHALLEPVISFARLAVVVVDEQHRFGVRQRERLLRKGTLPTVPHALYLSATPIPRSLALALYGDLELAELRGRPGGPLGCKTVVGADREVRAQAYATLRSELEGGRQGYVICPQIREGKGVGRAAEDHFARLVGGALAGFSVGLLHGALRPAEQADLLERFAVGALDALVATTVVEVGIDVPNATVIVVEDAHRFGLAQLHQLRGRVGRDGKPSYCFLLAAPGEALGRLAALETVKDGFVLAALDLKLRGRGDLAGTRQSGVQALSSARLPEDRDLLLYARRLARQLLSRDPLIRDPVHRPLRHLVSASELALAP